MTTTSDPISDLLTRIRNALKAQHRFIELPSSNMNFRIAEILREQGFVENVMVKEEDGRKVMRIMLKYGLNRTPVINSLKRMSKPGLRRYVSSKKIPLVCGGLGISIVSTSHGVMAGHEARGKKLGGELICLVW
ncbi:MAG: 30S ribosomal protein S8 [Chlamydiota bacterium]